MNREQPNELHRDSIVDNYVEWANTLDSSGEDSTGAKGRIDVGTLGVICRNMSDIVLLSKDADLIKKWVFYGKSPKKGLPVVLPISVRYAENAYANLNHDMIRVYHALLGLVTEVGELFEMFQAHILKSEPFDWDNFTEEVGDLFWYMALLARAKGYGTFIPFMISNKAKLMTRYATGKFTKNDAVNRDTLQEMKSLVESISEDGVYE